MSIILRVLALVAFTIAFLTGAAVFSTTSGFFTWDSMVPLGLGLWLLSTFTQLRIP